LERSDNVADIGHAFAVLKRGYARWAVCMHEREMSPGQFLRKETCCLLVGWRLNRLSFAVLSIHPGQRGRP
jgi:hypothetical protein